MIVLCILSLHTLYFRSFLWRCLSATSCGSTCDITDLRCFKFYSYAVNMLSKFVCDGIISLTLVCNHTINKTTNTPSVKGLFLLVNRLDILIQIFLSQIIVDFGPIVSIRMSKFQLCNLYSYLTVLLKTV